jgi:cellulose biosynthesis protein BcsQ
MTLFDWQKVLENLPNNANELIISRHFVEPLLEELGFDNREYYPSFPTGKGAKKVDYAARKNIDGDTFLETKTNPDLIIEVKGRSTATATIFLGNDSPQYEATKQQLKEYLLEPNCQTVRWGIITNANHLQLFRKHGKIVVPATENILIKKSDIDRTIDRLKAIINSPNKALTISVYNNKGGVGKTTTTSYLSTVLGLKNKKVLIVDFDGQQADLTHTLKVTPREISLSRLLTEYDLDIKEAIQSFNIKTKNKSTSRKIFDVIPVDDRLDNLNKHENITDIDKGNTRLRYLLEPIRDRYDYIILDTPTNWSFFSQSCVYASDVVLIPVKHDGFASLNNAAKVIAKFIPEIQKLKNDGTPIALPIFFNCYKEEETAQAARNTIDNFIKKDPKLEPYFYPKNTKKTPDKSIFKIPKTSIISKAAFQANSSCIMHKRVIDYYKNLVEEYFLD